jgi:hypothetical protein
MNDLSTRVLQLLRQGYCCSQILIKLGLEAQGKDNPDLLNAVAGLCQGLYWGMCCGTLTGAACLLSLYDKEKAASDMIPKLSDWFERTYTPCYGGINCHEILGDNPLNKIERCPRIMEETFEKCRELLAECDYEI